MNFVRLGRSLKLYCGTHQITVWQWLVLAFHIMATILDIRVAEGAKFTKTGRTYFARLQIVRGC